jgi:hypothetical protein
MINLFEDGLYFRKNTVKTVYVITGQIDLHKIIYKKTDNFRISETKTSNIFGS